MATSMRVIKGSTPISSQIERPKTAGKSIPPYYQHLLEQEYPLAQTYSTAIESSFSPHVEPVHQSHREAKGLPPNEAEPPKQGEKNRSRKANSLSTVGQAQKSFSTSSSLPSSSKNLQRKGPGRPRTPTVNLSVARKRMRHRNYYNIKRGKSLESLESLGPKPKRRLSLTLEERARRSQDAKTRLLNFNLDVAASRKAVANPPPEAQRGGIGQIEEIVRTEEEEADHQWKLYKRREGARQRLYKKEEQAIRLGLPIPVRKRGKKPIANPTPDQARHRLAFQRWRDKKALEKEMKTESEDSLMPTSSSGNTNNIQNDDSESPAISIQEAASLSWNGKVGRRSRQRRRSDFRVFTIMD